MYELKKIKKDKIYKHIFEKMGEGLIILKIRRVINFVIPKIVTQHILY